MAGQSQNARAGIRQADRNRERRIAASRRLHELLDLVEKPEFRGTISVEVSGKDGALGVPKFTRVQYDPDCQDN